MTVWALPPFCETTPQTENDFFSMGWGAFSKIPSRFFGVLVWVHTHAHTHTHTHTHTRTRTRYTHNTRTRTRTHARFFHFILNLKTASSPLNTYFEPLNQ